jgi:hypothetical protein
VKLTKTALAISIFSKNFNPKLRKEVLKIKYIKKEYIKIISPITVDLFGKKIK